MRRSSSSPSCVGVGHNVIFEGIPALTGRFVEDQAIAEGPRLLEHSNGMHLDFPTDPQSLVETQSEMVESAFRTSGA